MKIPFAKKHKPFAQCWGKRRHVTLTAARKTIQELDPSMTAYRCPWCRGWHIGHK